MVAAIVSLWTISSTLNSPFRVLCIFPSRYLSSIGLSLMCSLGWNLPPVPWFLALFYGATGFLGTAISNSSTLQGSAVLSRVRFSSRRHRAFTFYDATFQWDFGRESRDEAGPRQATPP